DETRVAILESRRVIQLYFDRKNKKSMVGNIYVGKVKNVLPSLDAAFVDIGEDRNAFLYVNEVGFDDSELEKGEDVPKKIQYVLKPNQTILVQVTKDPMKTKGARLTTFISIPGRYLVLAPFNDGVGVSKKLADEERERLRKIATEIKPKDLGLIVRTAAQGVDRNMLQKDLKILIRNLNQISKNSEKRKKPGLVSQEHTMIMRLLRDIFDEDFNAIYVDKKTTRRDIGKYFNSVGIKFSNIIVHHGQENLFEEFNVNESIESALERKVWLKSGGFIVIDHGEAMTTIDVNTGKYTSGKSSGQAILRTNLEAAETIANQLRLRDIGGIIVIDFIDMTGEKDRNRVARRFQQCLENDKTKAEIMKFSKLGLMEMTRKNVSDGILGTMCKVCPCCEGRGFVKSEETIRLEIERKVRKLARESKNKAFLFKLNSDIAALIIGQDGKNLKHLESTTKRYIAIQSDPKLPLDTFLLIAEGTVGNIREAARPCQVGDILDLTVEEQYLHNKNDAISRLDGYIVQIIGGGKYLGKRAKVKIKSVSRTSAVAEIIT
ncbi:MAG: Rne/Rng family ribonuclease, partial [Actinobacteria bacterium]|nr:Rne/Rng family ribonuclease [Actinomycetota bacterium]